MSLVTKNQFKRLFNEQDGCCYYCGIILSDVKVNVDHVIPRSKGGSGSVRNLVLSCYECNMIKLDNDIEVFRRKLIEIGYIEDKFCFEIVGLDKKGDKCNIFILEI